MPLKLVLAFSALALFPMEAESREKANRTDDSVREACQEEARLVHEKNRRIDRDHLMTLRREYTENCLKKAKRG